MNVSVILHAYRWPERAAVESLRASLRATIGDGVEIIEAREDEKRAVGAAALVNRAVSGSRGDRLLVLEPASEYPAEAFARLVSSPGLACDAEAPCSAWSIERRAFDAAGGLDERLWSVGYVEDLAARFSLAGQPVAALALDGRRPGPEP